MVRFKAVSLSIALLSLLGSAACTPEDDDRKPSNTGAGGGGSTTGVAGTGGGAAGTTGAAGTSGAAGTTGVAGTGGDAAGTSGAAGTTGAAGTGVPVTDGGTDAGDGGSIVVNPGTEGNGRFMIERPAVPPEAANLMAGVTAGMMRSFQITSTTYPNTTRTVQVWTPAGYVANTTIAFMVFHDGPAYVSNFKIPIIFANLIAAKKIPPMVGIFIPPSGNRSVEYDTVTDKYAQFVTTEVLPKVEALGIKLTTDPEASGTGGHSSGGICAFSMAWFHPERYRRVLSNSGSFTHLQTPGGELYDQMIRTTTPKKPIRTAMTVGTMDLGGTRWYMASEMLGKALLETGYDARYLVINNGTHDQSSPMPTTPELLQWLWRGYPVTGPTR
jgi:enterochelin esterase family protein